MDPLTRYERLKELGAGTYGCVWLARDRETGQKVALKRIKLDSPDEGIPATAIREIAILKELKHRNIVELISVVHTDTKLTLVFEYAETDLKKHLDSQQGRLAPAELKSIMSQILRGLAFVHNRRVLHRDLKPHNILMTKDGVVKIADFGLARGSGIPVRSFTHEVVTLWYRPPEVLLGCRKYGGALDIWSLGCIFYELATGKALFPAKNEQEELLKIFKVCGTPTRESWPGVGELPQWRDDFPVYPGTPIPDLLPNLDEQGRDLFAKMMHIDPAKRISARDALTHPWFTQG